MAPDLPIKEEGIRYHCDATLTVDTFPYRHYYVLDLGHEDMHESVSGVVWQAAKASAIIIAKVNRHAVFILSSWFLYLSRHRRSQFP